MALHIISGDSLNIGHQNLKNYSEAPPTGILGNFENGKMQKFGFSLQDFKNLLQNYSTKFLDIACK